MVELKAWTVNISGVVTKDYSVEARTPEEAIDEATQNFYDEFGDNADIEDIIESDAFPEEDIVELEEEEFES